MFDKTTVESLNNSYNNFNFNNHSASGLLCKSMVKSKILRFDRHSEYEEMIFSDEPYINKTITKKGYYGNYETEEKIKIIVLQVLLISDERFLVECITEDDFNEELGLKNVKKNKNTFQE